MSFRITGLPVDEFSALFGLTEGELAVRGVERIDVTNGSGLPCRVTLEDAEVGETVLLLNYEHQPADNAFRSRHAIFVRENAGSTFDRVDEIPDQLTSRLLSVRAFDNHDHMIDADVTDGTVLAPLLHRFLDSPATAYVHVHFARRGCFAARVKRA